MAERRDGSRAGDVLFAAIVAALFGLLVVRVVPELFDGRLVDTDSYMRLVRVRRLLDGGGWFDGTIPRSDAPFGETLHWTRPVDVLLIAGALLLRPFVGPAQALHLAGVALSPLLLIGVCFTSAWAVRPLAGSRVRTYTMITVLAQVGAMGYALPGRADHHMLILLAFTAMCGGALRLLEGPEHRGAVTAGAWAALGIWISTEFLVPVAVLLLACTVAWILDGGALATRVRTACVTLLGITAIAVIAEHAPSSLLVVEYDRISAVHVVVLGIVTLFWVAAARSGAASAAGRLLFATVGGALALGALYGLAPRFFGGPMVDVDPELKRRWLPFLTEYQPFLVPHGLSDWGRMLAYLGTVLLAVPAVVRGVRVRGPGWRPWVFLAIALAVFVPLGIRWVRFVMYAELIGVLGAMALLASLLEWAERAPAAGGVALRRVGVSAGVIAGPLLLGAAVMAAGGERGVRVQAAAATQTSTCSIERIVRALSDPTELGARPHTVLAHVDLGPVLLYRTAHAVVATPYHRNAHGILDAQRIFETADLEEAHRMIEARGVDVVVTCGVEAPPDREGAFVSRLRRGAAPPWIVPAEGAAAGLEIFLVRGAPADASDRS